MKPTKREVKQALKEAKKIAIMINIQDGESIELDCTGKNSGEKLKVKVIKHNGDIKGKVVQGGR